MRKLVKISYTTDEGDVEVSMMVPSKNAICSECEGEGQVDNPAFSNGISESEREEMGEEDFGSYMDGRYDVAYPCCQGAKIVQVPNVSGMSMDQKRHAVLVRRFRRDEIKFEREYAAVHRAEMAFGC